MLGENYFSATFGAGFLSRRACLSAPAVLPPGADLCVATSSVDVPSAGSFAVLARYEYADPLGRFSTRWNLTIEQPPGTTVFAKEYGVLGANGLPTEGSGSPLWEGVGGGSPPRLDTVKLAKGHAVAKLSVVRQPGRFARRNVDVVVLTQHASEVQLRAQMKARESNFQFDGMLTQAGQVYAKLRNEADGVPMNLSVPFAVEHSSYWVHTRYVSVDTLHFVAVSAVS